MPGVGSKGHPMGTAGAPEDAAAREHHVRVSRAGPGDADGWARFVRSSVGGEIGHCWEFHDLLALVFGQTQFRLIARRGERWAGVLPLVLQKSFLGTFLTSVPYLNYAGILGDDPDARIALAEAAVDLAREVGADRLELRGRNGADLPIEPWRGKCGYRLELPDSAEEMRQALGAKVRAQIKRPLKDGYTARTLVGGGSRLLYPVLVRKWHELGSPILPRAFFERLENLFGEDLFYAIVEKEGRAVAAGAVLVNGPSAEIPWAASLREHDRFGVNMLVYWAALESAISRGARIFDFGRSSPGTGNARFKLQWGASESALVWNVMAATTRGRSAERGDDRRALVAAAWRRLPRALTSRLGPFLAARIPY